jgi:hypothetical protein
VGINRVPKEIIPNVHDYLERDGLPLRNVRFGA